jgi:8-oxo-dGTP diphosphatase
MIHRNARRDDPHFGKYNGLGGKLDAREDVLACMRREIEEEAGIECERIRLVGTISWPGFGDAGEDWLGFIFVVDTYRGMPRTANPEGELRWVAIDRLLELELWPGDRYFLPLVFADPLRQFHGVMPYRDGAPVSWAVSYVD